MRRSQADSTNRSLAAFEKLQHIPLSQSGKLKTSLSMLSTIRRRPRRVARLKAFAFGAKKAIPAPGHPDDLLITNA